MAWAVPGDSAGPAEAAVGGFRAVVIRAVGVSAGLWDEAPGASCGNCGSLSLGVGSA